jgi:hypothetical protein
MYEILFRSQQLQVWRWNGEKYTSPKKMMMMIAIATAIIYNTFVIANNNISDHCSSPTYDYLHISPSL